jgi:hypothetical protein
LTKDQENVSMTTSRTQRNDCDLVALDKDNIAFTGTAHIDHVAIQTRVLPDPMTFPKSSIAYIHFKSLPYQENDYIQLTSGGSAEGEIVKLDKLVFTVAESGEDVTFPRQRLLSLMFLCSMASAAKVYRRALRTAAR